MISFANDMNAITAEALRVLEGTAEPTRADVLYGSIPFHRDSGWILHGGYGDDSALPLKPSFPRTEGQRIARMNRYVEWKRLKLREKHQRELLWAGIFFIATPIAISVLSWLWRWAIVSVLG